MTARTYERLITPAWDVIAVIAYRPRRTAATGCPQITEVRLVELRLRRRRAWWPWPRWHVLAPRDDAPFIADFLRPSMPHGGWWVSLADRLTAPRMACNACLVWDGRNAHVGRAYLYRHRGLTWASETLIDGDTEPSGNARWHNVDAAPPTAGAPLTWTADGQVDQSPTEATT